MKSENSRASKAGFAPSAGRHYLDGMTDKPKRPRDANQLAKFIVDVAIGEAEASPPEAPQAKGGKVGGIRRRERLTDQQRSEIASLAAAARWKKS